jgi:hypothetical protein
MTLKQKKKFAVFLDKMWNRYVEVMNDKDALKLNEFCVLLEEDIAWEESLGKPVVFGGRIMYENADSSDNVDRRKRQCP